MKKKLTVSLILVLAIVCAMVVPAMAAGDVVRPSVSFKGYPTAVKSADGYKVLKSADQDPKDSSAAISADDVVFAAAKQFTGDDKEAYNALSGAAKISDICKNFLEILKKVKADVTEDKMVVRDVFSVAFSGDAKKASEEGEYVVLPLNYKLAADKAVVVMQYLDGEWTALDPACYELADNVLTLKLCKPGVVAIAVEK